MAKGIHNVTLCATSLADFILQQAERIEGDANYLRNVGIEGTQPGSVNDSVRDLIDHALTTASSLRAVAELHRGGHSCPTVDEPELWVFDGDCETLRLFARQYADSPNFDSAWRKTYA